MKFISILFSILFLCGLVSCKRNDAVTPVNQNSVNKTITKTQPFAVTSFSNVPKEIDGCACYFSKESIEFKNNKYVYVNDFAETSFVTINDTLIKFTQTAYRKADTTAAVAKYISRNYKMMILVKDNQTTGKESASKTGVIKITDAKGKSVKQTFYGKCGC